MSEASKANQLRAAVAILTVLFLCNNVWRRSKETPAPKPPEVDNSEEVETEEDAWGVAATIPMALKGAGQDSAMLSGLCEGIASILEMDGERQSPQIVYVIHVHDLRMTAIKALLKDGPGHQPKYPQFNTIVGDVFGRVFPDGHERLTDARRREAVQMFQALGKACRGGGNR